MQKNERIFNNMKRKVVIKGIFNDYFTGYKDKESSVVVILDGYKVIEQRILKIKRLFSLTTSQSRE